MDSDTELATKLRALDEQWAAITEIPEPPRSTMDVIEYGLGKQRRAEVYVNRLLKYLLDPEEPHRMETEFLDAFLRGLPDACNFEEDTYDLSDVRVSEQVTIQDDEDEERSSPGYVDLVLDVPNEWFVMIELKFSAEETGTRFYCRSTHLGGQAVDEYESGQYYLYMHQSDRPEASGCCFENWTWRAFVEDVLEPFIAENAIRYPQRSVGQLHDLRDDLKEIAGMSEHQDTAEEKVELYLDYYDAIADVSATFDDAWKSYRKRWGTELATMLEIETVDRASPAEDAAVQISRHDRESELWSLRDRDADWQHIFKHGWWRREGSPETLNDRPDDLSDLRIGFYHRMGGRFFETASSNSISGVWGRTLPSSSIYSTMLSTSTRTKSSNT